MKLYQIDAFTKEIFKGNPAAVCIVEEDLSDAKMQQIAIEMNLSETAFVRVGEDSCNLRWFTPAKEVPLCGHATLATSFVLFNEGYWPLDKAITFNTLSGLLTVSRNDDASLSMNFPSAVPKHSDEFSHEDLTTVFGGEVLEVLTIPNELIVIFKDLKTLLNTRPDPSVISTLAVNGVIVSAWSDNGEYDLASRYFAPNLGINEDPVTGFMHTILTPYWSAKKGQTTFKAFQASERTGRMTAELKGDRVVLTGDALKVFETELNV